MSVRDCGREAFIPLSRSQVGVVASPAANAAAASVPTLTVTRIDVSAGDTLILHTPEYMAPSSVEALRSVVASKFPGVRVLTMTNNISLTVVAQKSEPAAA